MFFLRSDGWRSSRKLALSAFVSLSVFTYTFETFATEQKLSDNSIDVYVLKTDVWVDKPVGKIEARLAQVIVPQEPLDGSANPSLGDFNSTVLEPVELRAVDIEGNQRLSNGKILESMGLEIGSFVNSSMINNGLQRLYRSGLFKDFRADISPDGVLSVYVEENPIINRIAFEGNKALKDELLETVLSSKTRRAYSVSKIDDDVRKIQTAYRQSGRFAALIKPVLIKRPQNRVDVIFEITEGNKTLVESINFVGNSFASSRELRDEMFTKTNNMISYIFGGDTYDPDKLTFDSENIRNFYLRHGYADFRILSTSSELDANQKGFNITISMEEGVPYNFGAISVNSSIAELDQEVLMKVVPFQKLDRFDNTKVQDALVALENAAQTMGVPFVRAIPQVRKNLADQQIDIIFVLEPSAKRYVELININGNVRTLDYVIRRELSISEGDPISQEKIEKSETELLNLGFFKSVNIVRRQGTNANDIILDVNVEEKSTGSINAGIGLSTSTGAFVTFGISESNFLGKGQKVAATVTAGAKKRDYDLSFREPRFMDRDLSASVRLFKTSDDRSTTRKYNFDSNGIALGFDQELFPNWYHHMGISVSKNKISNIKSDASLLVKNQKGTINKNTLSQSLFYDVRNSTIKPTKGYRVGGALGITGLVGNYKLLKASLSGQFYTPITDTITLNVNGSVARLTPISGTDVRIIDNYFAGGESDIRGFKSNGIGPRVQSTKEALGGRDKFKGSVNIKMLSGLPRHVGVNLVAFSDFGFVRNHGFSNSSNLSINETGSMRVSAGLSIEFDSIVPISLYYANAIKKEAWDDSESFVFSFATSF